MDVKREVPYHSSQNDGLTDCVDNEELCAKLCPAVGILEAFFWYR